MYRKIETIPTPVEKFELPFEGQLAEDNRWVIMANLIPWSEFEDEYAKQFTIEMVAPAKSFRTAIGALIIKERLGLSDRETVEQIRENPYLQYFIGLNSYSNEVPFEASMLVHFKKGWIYCLRNWMLNGTLSAIKFIKIYLCTVKKIYSVKLLLLPLNRKTIFLNKKL